MWFGCPTASLVKIIISYNNVNIVIILLIDQEEDKVFDFFSFFTFHPMVEFVISIL